MPNLQLLLDQEVCEIYMENEDFKRDIANLMDADQDVQFKVKTLIIKHLKSNQAHILDWLLVKSPNLIDLQFYFLFPIDNFNEGLEI
jgi:hypothetical protein